MRKRAAATKSTPALPGPWLIALCAALAAVYALAARRLPVGALNDDAANVLLARALLHGSFSFPGGLGKPAEFLPGLPLLLALPSALVAPHWGLLRLIPLACCALSLGLAWRLARRLLSPEAAAAAVLLAALNPVLVGLGGLVMPYAPYLALSLALIDGADAPGARSLAWLCAGAAAAALLRPHGLLLAACLALPLAHRRRWGASAAVLASAVLPVGAWVLHERLAPGAAAGYAEVWRRQLADIGTPALELSHAADLLARLFAESMLGLADPWLPEAARVAAGLAFAAAAAAGAVRLLRRRRDDARAFALVLYAAGIFFLHMTWRWVSTRYAFPLVPLVWILVAAAAEPLFERRPVTARALVLALALATARFDAVHAQWGLTPFRFAPRAVDFIRASVPADARLYAVNNYTVALLTERACGPLPVAPHVAIWEVVASDDRVDRVLFQEPRPGDEFFPSDLPPTYQRVLSERLIAGRSVAEFRDDAEGTLLLRLKP